MKRTFIFKAGSRELALPVTPESFSLDYGVRMETVNIHDVGDVDVLGKTTLAAMKLDCLFPAQEYVFADMEMEPYDYVRQFQKWVRTGKVLRFIIPDTIVNLPVRVESIQYGEGAGSNDVRATVVLRQHRALAAPQTEAAPTENKAREEQEPVDGGSETLYTAQYGDTLCSICRKFYGDGSAKFYNALASYNGKPNPNILMTGEVLTIPPRDVLGV